MAHTLNVERLQTAFKGRPDLIGAIQQAAAAPNWIELFNEITSYVSDLQISASSEPASKKRKLDETLPINSISNGNGTKNGTSGGATVTTAPDTNEPALLQIREISLVMPQRKKYTLEITKSFIRARHPDTKELIPGISYEWKNISYAFCLPVPEKTQKQYNYILFPERSNLPALPNTPVLEPLVFTIPAAAPKPGTISGADAGAASAVSDEFKSLFDWALTRALKDSGSGTKIVEPDPKHFASVIKEAHRPNEKATFVKGFRGSKDGYLFFLSTGILWGFKKPLLFLPKERIAAVSYLSVLQRTFNLSVEVYASDGDDENKEEFEFAMLDQEDFAGIDTYVKRHGLMDASMAEQRKAKRLGINVVKGEDGAKVDVGDAGELAKAEAELQDAEDEEDEDEEDYNPGSEGESEGSGSSSEDEDGDGSGGDAAEGDDDDDEDDDDDGEDEA